MKAMDDDPPERGSASVNEYTHPDNGTETSSFFQQLRDWTRHNFGCRKGATMKEALEEAIEEVLEERQEDMASLKPEQTEILRNVLAFGEIDVHDIMTPRTDIVAIQKNTTFDELKAFISEQQHTRMPVYDGSLDEIKGFLHAKDLLAVMARGETFDMQEVMRPMIFVAPSMRVIDLLVRFRASGAHMAIVVDEYGGTDGLVTLEDIFEEIVGDIQDEHDEEEDSEELVRTGDNEYVADARLRVDKLEEELGISLQEDGEGEEFDTVGGLIFFELGRVPSKGEQVTLPVGVSFEVLEVDSRRIHRVKVAREPVEPALD